MPKHAPKKEKQLDNIRGIPEKFKSGPHAKNILQIISTALSKPKEEWPKKERKSALPQALIPAVEMLKMLLKIQASEHKVVPRLIASVSDLEMFVQNPSSTDSVILKGWRNDIFGKYAKDLIDEKLALKLENKKIIKQSV